MRVGLALPEYDIETSAPLSTSDIADYAVRAETWGFASVWLMDHYYVVRGGKRVGGHEPLTTLSFIASKTSRVFLGPLVLSNTFRHPGQLAREASTLSDLSAGRFILGLGCGSSVQEHEEFGVPYEHRVSRLEETLQVLRPILEGKSVTHEGRFVQMRSAQIATPAAPAPIWIAAFGPRMMNLTARYADGWIANWSGCDLGPLRTQLEGVKSALRKNDRDFQSLEIVAPILAVPCTESVRPDVLSAIEGQQWDSVPIGDRVIVGSAARIADCVRKYENLGVTYIVLAPTPRQFGRWGDVDFEELAQIPSALQ